MRIKMNKVQFVRRFNSSTFVEDDLPVEVPRFFGALCFFSFSSGLCGRGGDTLCGVSQERRFACKRDNLLGREPTCLEDARRRAFQLTLADKCATIRVDVVFWRGADMELTFETERLIVRRLKREDALPLYNNHRDAEVRQWFPNESYADVSEALGAIDFFVERVNAGSLPYVLAAVLKKSGELIGDIGISKVDCETNGLEIGYVVSEQYRGRGYATELVVAMTKFAASTFGAKVLYGRVIRGNDASSRVLEKSGFKFVKEELYADDDPYGNGMLVYEYRIG